MQRIGTSILTNTIFYSIIYLGFHVRQSITYNKRGMNMLEFIIQYWMQILFGIVVTVLSAGYAGLKRQIKKYKNLELGMQCLLRAELIRMHDKYMERGYCPIYAKDALERAYSSYHALEGNGTVTGLVEDVRMLPTEKKKTE